MNYNDTNEELIQLHVSMKDSFLPSQTETVQNVINFLKKCKTEKSACNNISEQISNTYIRPCFDIDREIYKSNEHI